MSEESYIRMQMDRIQIPSVKSSRFMLYIWRGKDIFTYRVVGRVELFSRKKAGKKNKYLNETKEKQKSENVHNANK